MSSALDKPEHQRSILKGNPAAFVVSVLSDVATHRPVRELNVDIMQKAAVQIMRSPQTAMLLYILFELTVELPM